MGMGRARRTGMLLLTVAIVVLTLGIIVMMGIQSITNPPECQIIESYQSGDTEIRIEVCK
jgi:hypothetical protein